MKTGSILCAIVTALCILAIGALAEVPNFINFQGTLADSNGNPITDTRQMDFAIYADSTGGSPLWSETHSSVEISDGLFRVPLGSVMTLPNSLFDGSVLWLGITVSPDVTEMTPRQSLVTVPYGFKSGESDHAVHSDTAAYALAGGSATNAWLLTGNSGTDSTNFLGTTDSTALELRVNNDCVMRFESAEHPTFGYGPNVIGGYSGNIVAEGGFSHTISGGGCVFYPDSINGNYCTISGGIGNTAIGIGSTVGGGYLNTANGLSTVCGGRYNIAYGVSVVGGGDLNTANGNFLYHSTVSGGMGNTASGDLSTVGGGWNNTASGDKSTVGGGYSNSASDSCAVVAGGCNQSADGENSAIGGGSNNVARGLASTIPGGMDNLAEGNYTVAMGRQAQAVHDGSFVWADGTGQDFITTSDNQFLIRASGGVGIGTENPQHQLDVAGDMSCIALHEASDLRLKTDIQPITNALCKIEQLQGVSFRWNNRAQSVGATPGDQQIGVIAQDVEQVFPELVTTPDDGYKSVDYTKLTAVLIEAVKELKTHNDKLRAENNTLKEDLSTITNDIEVLKELIVN